MPSTRNSSSVKWGTETYGTQINIKNQHDGAVEVTDLIRDTLEEDDGRGLHEGNSGEKDEANNDQARWSGVRSTSKKGKDKKKRLADLETGSR